MVASNCEDYFENEYEDDDNYVGEYDISSNPNDFNVVTLNSYIDNNAIKIPSFQRNYVWDIHRASRWIESLLLGLPVPQLFFYEAARNSFLVVDGQQRLMSIYYFLHGRFPKQEQRSVIRDLFDENGRLGNDLFYDNDLFQDFKLRLPSSTPGVSNRFNGLAYSDLDEYRTVLDLRTVRCVMVKQNAPSGDDSSVYEIFSRLNTGGTNLRPQEIRACMYHSDFYDMLARINREPDWRRFFKKQELDLHMRDTEILLRVFAILANGDSYKTSMAKFLNAFSKEMMHAPEETVQYFESLFQSFLKHTSSLDPDSFINIKSNKFNVSLFEAVFAATCKGPYSRRKPVESDVDQSKIQELLNDPQFAEASSARTTNSANVRIRLDRAFSVFEVSVD